MESVPAKAPNYYTIHDRIRKARGLPGTYLCRCGQQAQEWAYVGPSDAPFRTERGMPYSADPFHYEPLCTLCHRRLDFKKETCRRGHPWTDDNVYIRPDTGQRMCRECLRLRQKARQDRQRKGIPNVYRVDCPDCGASVFVSWLTRHVCGQAQMRLSYKKKRKKNKPRMVCKRGHEFTTENTYTGPDGRRQCKACIKLRAVRYVGKSNPRPRVDRRKLVDREKCPRGHEITPESIYTRKDGYTECRDCRREDGANYRKRRLQGS